MDGTIFLFPDPNHFASGRGEISTDPTAQVREQLKVTFSGHRRTNSVIQDWGLSPSRCCVQGSSGELDYCSRSKGWGDAGCCDPAPEPAPARFPHSGGQTAMALCGDAESQPGQEKAGREQEAGSELKWLWGQPWHCLCPGMLPQSPSPASPGVGWHTRTPHGS